MNDWHELIRAANNESHETPIDWGELNRAVDRGIQSANRRRWIRAGGFALCTAAAVAACAVLAAKLVSPTDKAEPAIVPPTNGALYDQTTLDDLIDECGSTLSSSATTHVAAISTSRHAAAVVAGNDAEANLCIGIDAGSGYGFVHPVQTPPARRPQRVNQGHWTWSQLPTAQTFVVAVNSEHLDRIAVAGRFGLGEQARSKTRDTFGLMILEPQRPIRSGKQLNFGLYDDNGCLCGATLDIAVANPPDVNYVKLEQP